MADIAYTYHPKEGSFVYGVPQRDLTQADADKAGPENMRTAILSGLYRPAKETKKEKAAREKAEAEAAAAALAAAEAAAAANVDSDQDDGGDGSDGDDDSGGAGEGNGQ